MLFTFFIRGNGWDPSEIQTFQADPVGNYCLAVSELRPAISTKDFHAFKEML